MARYPPPTPQFYSSVIASLEVQTNVDLVVLNGGINDVGVQYIFNAHTDQRELADTVQRACYTDMCSLLRKAVGYFTNPRTTLIALGYYPVLKGQSDAWRVPTMLPVFGVSLASVVFPYNPVAKIVSNSLLFWQESNNAIARAAADVNQEIGNEKIVSLKPGFTEANAAFAQSPWVFGANADLSAQDERHRYPPNRLFSR